MFRKAFSNMNRPQGQKQRSRSFLHKTDFLYSVYKKNHMIYIVSFIFVVWLQFMNSKTVVNI